MIFRNVLLILFMACLSGATFARQENAESARKLYSDGSYAEAKKSFEAILK